MERVTGRGVAGALDSVPVAVQSEFFEAEREVSHLAESLAVARGPAFAERANPAGSKIRRRWRFPARRFR